MKICLVSNLYPPLVQGGAEIYVGRLARALAQDHRVIVVTSEPGAHLAPSREVSADGTIVYRLAPLNVAHLARLPRHLFPRAAFRTVDFYHPQVARAMTDVIARERPDVIHIHNSVGLSLAAVLSAAGAGRVPVAMTLHDYGLCCVYADLRHPDGRGCAPHLACRAVSAINRHITESVGLAISPSAYALRIHEQRGFFRRAARQILGNGIPAVAPGRPRTEKSTFDILFIGRVQSHKGPEVLIRAFRRMADPTLRLHVAGAGPALAACRALAAGDGRITLYGFVDGGPRIALLESADCVVLPSLWPENAPVTIQEAFQYGPVVIASRVGGIPEMVRDGVNGFLVEPGDETALAGAIERVRRSPDLVATLRASAHKTVGLHDMSFHTAQLGSAYRRLLAAHRAGGLESRAA